MNLAEQERHYNDLMKAVNKLGHDVKDLTATSGTSERKVRVEEVLADYMLDEFDLDEEEHDFLIDSAIS